MARTKSKRATRRDFLTDQERREAVLRWQRSGLSQQKFCKEIGIHPNTLCKWKRQMQLTTTENKVSFVPVVAKVAPVSPLVAQSATRRIVPLSAPCAPLRLEVADRFRVEIPEHFSPSSLRNLVITLETI